ncbi:MAG: hypothetical protein ABIT37_00490 [Luteolibacter sp.]
MKYRANWLAWALQFAFGVILGLVLGFGSLHPRNVGEWMDPKHVPGFLFGSSLLLAGLFSLYGDQLWFGDSYRVIPPDGVRHSRTSKLISQITLLAGVVLITLALCRNYGVF